MIFKAGDRVFYWAARKGERAHKKIGTIQQLGDTFCRVRLDGDHPVPVQTVELTRLVLVEPADHLDAMFRDCVTDAVERGINVHKLIADELKPKGTGSDD